MNIIYQLWGEGIDLTVLQVSCRTIVMFFVALVLLRAGGVRIFSRKSAFDEIITIMLGAVLSRGIVGATPFGTVVISGVLMIAVYRFIGWASMRNYFIEGAIKGKPVILYKNDQLLKVKMQKNLISEEDIKESLRLETNQSSLDKVSEVRLETNGRLSFVWKKEEESNPR